MLRGGNTPLPAFGKRMVVGVLFSANWEGMLFGIRVGRVGGGGGGAEGRTSLPVRITPSRTLPSRTTPLEPSWRTIPGTSTS